MSTALPLGWSDVEDEFLATLKADVTNILGYKASTGSHTFKAIACKLKISSPYDNPTWAITGFFVTTALDDSIANVKCLDNW